MEETRDVEADADPSQLRVDLFKLRERQVDNTCVYSEKGVAVGPRGALYVVSSPEEIRLTDKAARSVEQIFVDFSQCLKHDGQTSKYFPALDAIAVTPKGALYCTVALHDTPLPQNGRVSPAAQEFENCAFIVVRVPLVDGVATRVGGSGGYDLPEAERESGNNSSSPWLQRDHAAGVFTGLTDLAISPNGHLYTGNTDTIYRITPKTGEVAVFLSEFPGEVPDNVSTAGRSACLKDRFKATSNFSCGISCDQTGNIYLANYRAIVKISPSGDLLESWPAVPLKYARIRRIPLAHTLISSSSQVPKTSIQTNSGTAKSSLFTERGCGDDRTCTQRSGSEPAACSRGADMAESMQEGDVAHREHNGHAVHGDGAQNATSPDDESVARVRACPVAASCVPSDRSFFAGNEFFTNYPVDSEFFPFRREHPASAGSSRSGKSHSRRGVARPANPGTSSHPSPRKAAKLRASHSPHSSSSGAPQCAMRSPSSDSPPSVNTSRSPSLSASSHSKLGGSNAVGAAGAAGSRGSKAQHSGRKRNGGAPRTGSGQAESMVVHSANNGGCRGGAGPGAIAGTSSSLSVSHEQLAVLTHVPNGSHLTMCATALAVDPHPPAQLYGRDVHGRLFRRALVPEEIGLEHLDELDRQLESYHSLLPWQEDCDIARTLAVHEAHMWFHLRSMQYHIATALHSRTVRPRALSPAASPSRQQRDLIPSDGIVDGAKCDLDAVGDSSDSEIPSPQQGVLGYNVPESVTTVGRHAPSDSYESHDCDLLLELSEHHRQLYEDMKTNWRDDESHSALQDSDTGQKRARNDQPSVPARSLASTNMLRQAHARALKYSAQHRDDAVDDDSRSELYSRARGRFPCLADAVLFCSKPDSSYSSNSSSTRHQRHAQSGPSTRMHHTPRSLHPSLYIGSERALQARASAAATAAHHTDSDTHAHAAAINPGRPQRRDPHPRATSAHTFPRPRPDPALPGTRYFFSLSQHSQREHAHTRAAMLLHQQRRAEQQMLASTLSL